MHQRYRRHRFSVCRGSDAFVNSGLCKAAGWLLGKPIRALFGLSDAGAGTLLIGFIGGFPSGAYSASKLYGDGIIEKNEAERLISFCNNATPAFVAGYVGSLIGIAGAGLFCYACILLPTLIYGIAIRKKPPLCAARADNKNGALDVFVTSIKEASLSSVYVCGFVIMFSVFSFCVRKVIPGDTVPALLVSVFEITGGVDCITSLGLPERLECSLCCFSVSLSGLCVLSQIGAETGKYGLSLGYYLLGKPVQAVCSFVLSYFLYPLIFGV